MKLSSHLVAVLLLGSIFVPAQTKEHPATYVDRGACPFECCTYRRWKVLKDTVTYAAADKQSRRVGTLKKGTWVRGLTGEVRTLTPGKFVVTKPHEKYRPGDILWVYTPAGEGFYKVWFKGQMLVEEMEYMSGPYETTYPKCSDSPDCWGELKVELKTVWWVKVRTSSGRIAWTDQTYHFGNMDACG